MSQTLTQTEVSSFFTPASRPDGNKPKMDIMENPFQQIKTITFDDGPATENGVENAISTACSNFSVNESDDEGPNRFKIRIPPPQDESAPRAPRPELKENPVKRGNSIFNRVFRRLSTSRSNLNGGLQNSQATSNQTIASGKSENSALTKRPSIFKRFLSTRKTNNPIANKTNSANDPEAKNLSLSQTSLYSTNIDQACPPVLMSVVPTTRSPSMRFIPEKTSTPIAPKPPANKTRANGKAGSILVSKTAPPLFKPTTNNHDSVSSSTSSKPLMPSYLTNYKPSYLNLTLAAYGYHGSAYSSIWNNKESESTNSGRSSSVPPQRMGENIPSNFLVQTALLEPPPWRQQLKVPNKRLPQAAKKENPLSSSSDANTESSHTVTSATLSDIPSIGTKSESVDSTQLIKSAAATGGENGRQPPNNITDNSTTDSKRASLDSEIQMRQIKMRTSNMPSVSSDATDTGLDQWQRNSLIMMSVAKSSPRGLPPTVAGRAESPTMDLASPSRPRVVDLMSHSAHGDLFNRKSIQEAAAPSSPPPTSEVPSTPEPKSNGVLKGPDLNDGNYYLLMVDQTEQEIQQQIDQIESDMVEHKDQIHDDVMGHLFTTVGKANLLLKKKFMQFRGLCHLNIEHMIRQSKGDLAEVGPEMVALGDDLAGFWAMCMLQVGDVQKMIQESDKFRNNNWQPIAPRRHSVASIGSTRPRLNLKKMRNGAMTPVTEDVNGNSCKESSSRDAARERLLKAKKEAMMRMKERKDQHCPPEDGVASFMIV